MAALDVAGAITNTKTMLSNLTAWKTICGVATADEAAQQIHEGGIEVESDDIQTTPCIILDVTSLPTDWMPSRLSGDLTIEVRVELEVPPEETSTYAKQYIWVWTQFGNILAGIMGAVGGAGQLMIRRLETPVMPGRVDPNTNNGRCEWGFVINLTTDFV